MRQSLFLFCVFAAVAAGAQDPSLVLADGGLQFPDGTVQVTAAAKGSAPVEDTGQKLCWDQSGNPEACPFTFQDGDFQAGVDWPTPRFTLNLDGTVTDHLTGLIWLRDAECFGTKYWEAAIDAVTDFAFGLTYDCLDYDERVNLGWRLPNVRELASLIDYGQSDPALPVGHFFHDVQLASYWSSTSVVQEPDNAWMVLLNKGDIVETDKGNFKYIWPVRGGQ